MSSATARKAQEFFARSNELALKVYDFRGQGVIATQFGRIARTRGDIESAERAFTEGLNKAQQVLDKQAVAVNLNYLGRIAVTRGKTLEAAENTSTAACNSHGRSVTAWMKV